MMKISKLLAVSAAVTAALSVASVAHAHQYYNLTGAGSVASGDSAIGFGLTNSINGTDGVSANSNGTNRVANGTNTYTVGDTTVNTLIPGTGTAAGTVAELPGSLPYHFYAGMHNTLAGNPTTREMYTGTSATDASGNLATNANSSLWKAYADKNGGANAATWGTIMADLPTNGDHPYVAVANNSTATSQGLDYDLIHISCGANDATTNCASAGALLTTITIANDQDYASTNAGLLDVALYRGADTNTGTNRNAAATFGSSGFQGSSLGAPIWTASMSSVSDILTYSFNFDQSEWNATGSSTSAHTNGFYTLVVGAHGGAASGVVYDLKVSNVPIPAAVWLFGSAMAGLMGFGRRQKQGLMA